MPLCHTGGWHVSALIASLHPHALPPEYAKELEASIASVLPKFQSFDERMKIMLSIRTFLAALSARSAAAGAPAPCLPQHL